MQAKSLIIIVIIAIIALLGFAAWTVLDLSILSQTDNQSTQTPVVPATFSKAVDDLHNASDSNFARGYQAELREDYRGAVTLYQAALAEEHSPAEEAHIKYRLGRALEMIDPVASIRTLKEVADNPIYPNIQKKYAVIFIPITIMRTHHTNTQVVEEALAGEPYSSFRGETINDTAFNFYEYSLTFGSTGVADFAVAQSLAEAVRDGVITDSTEVEETMETIATNMRSGRAFIEEIRNDTRNAGLIPRIYRSQARANAVLAQLGDQFAIESFDFLFLEAINQGLIHKLDGAIRWDYFLYGYDTFGPASFEKTQSHLNFLLNNLNTYTGIRDYLRSEKDNRYNSKQKVVELANRNQALRSKLLELGWTEADFQN